jgi:glucosyl-3-phosphoglycerate synthase
MSDFFQNGEIATFHRLGKRDYRKIEEELEELSKIRPISLVLPFIPQEMQGQGLQKIIKNLKEIGYLKNIVVAMGKTDQDEFKIRF